MLRRDSTHAPLSFKENAIHLPRRMYRTVEWREGTNQPLSSRIAALQVRPAHQDYYLEEMRAEEWLLIEWPKDEAEPTEYFFSTLKNDVTLERLVYATKMRWRIGHDLQKLKQEVGLSHFEGRGWRDFRRHATLSIATFGLLMSARLQMNSEHKNIHFHSKNLPYPVATFPWEPSVCSATFMTRSQQYVCNWRDAILRILMTAFGAIITNTVSKETGK